MEEVKEAALSDEQIDMILDAAKVPEPPGNEEYKDYDLKVARAVAEYMQEQVRQAVLEERERAARVCEAIAARDGGGDEWDSGRIGGAEQCAEQIRKG